MGSTAALYRGRRKGARERGRDTPNADKWAALSLVASAYSAVARCHRPCCRISHSSQRTDTEDVFRAGL